MPYMPYVWLGLLVISVLIEGATMDLVTVWFALGSLAALILSCIQPEAWIVQVIVFLVVSSLSLLLLRPLARRGLSLKKEATNADRVISQIGVVIEDIDNLHNAGAVKVGGKVWTARAYTGETILCDASVRVLFIEGVKLIVTPVIAETVPDTDTDTDLNLDPGPGAGAGAVPGAGANPAGENQPLTPDL
ncbi:MAG: NfeD family protein [Oscillospiraceae bacterium]|nr:NfeD family protein [Oscillospiraceae bacterium]